VFLKRARNTLLLFSGSDALDAPLRLACLDGCIIHKSDDKRQFAVEIRKDLFKATRYDINIALTSAKDASAWEKALVKGVAWHGEQKNKARAEAADAAGAGGAPLSSAGGAH
ncbi:hypothetical protein T484DRAFT_1828718, partial [Baffinella frigidus]